jgi:hypothetical protein
MLMLSSLVTIGQPQLQGYKPSSHSCNRYGLFDSNLVHLLSLHHHLQSSPFPINAIFNGQQSPSRPRLQIDCYISSF